MKSINSLFVLGTAGAVALFGMGPVAAQEKPAAVKREARLVPLKHASAVDVAAILAQVHEELARIAVAEPRTNSILMHGTAAELEIAEPLVKALDVRVEARVDTRPQTAIVQLDHVVPDEHLQKTLEVVFEGRGRFALDPQRRSVILSGDKETLEEAGKVLKHLDRPVPEKPSAGPLRVRIVWLASGLKRDDVPADLADVITELNQLGIDELRLAAQAIVNVQLNATFQVEGSADIGLPCLLAVTGVVSEKDAQPALEIDIKATRAGAPLPGAFGGANVQTMPICNLRTRITAPLGHAVVLGVTPTEGITSVFVVQVLRKESKPAGK
jgi:hypothetical protein